jgi:VCBS repeat-containing protein
MVRYQFSKIYNTFSFALVNEEGGDINTGVRASYGVGDGGFQSSTSAYATGDRSEAEFRALLLVNKSTGSISASDLLDPKLSPAQVAFRLGKVINKDRNDEWLDTLTLFGPKITPQTLNPKTGKLEGGIPTAPRLGSAYIILGNAITNFVGSNPSASSLLASGNHREFREYLGRGLGSIIAHELGHNFGLLDEYYSLTKDSANNPVNSFMGNGSTQRDYKALDLERLSLALALNTTGAAYDEARQKSQYLVRQWIKLFADKNAAASTSGPVIIDFMSSGSTAATAADVEATTVGDGALMLRNGDFSEDEPGGKASWQLSGAGSVTSSQLVLREAASLISQASQEFIIPDRARALRFTLLRADFISNGEGPQDAFEFALLTSGWQSLGGIIGLSATDAAFNLQADGAILAGSKVRGLGIGEDGKMPADGPITVELDLTGVEAGTAVRLFFDLIGFGSAASEIRIDDVEFIFGSQNRAPVAGNDIVELAEDVSALIPVRLNDTDEDGGALTTVLVTGPAHGALVLNQDGTFTYTPEEDFFAADSFTYRVSDGTELSNIATVSLTVTPVNDAPVRVGAIADQTSPEDEPWSFIVSTDTFSDIDSSLSYMAKLASGEPLPTWLAFDASTQTFSGTPPQDLNGSLELTIAASDGEFSATDTFMLTIIPVNDRPVAQVLSGKAMENGPAVTLTPSFSDVDAGDTHTLSIDTSGTKGAMTINPNGTFTYNPNGMFETLKADATATDTFTYTVTDQGWLSDTKIVTLTITGQNDGPVTVADSGHTDQDTILTTSAAVSVLTNDTDVDDGDTRTVVAVNSSAAAVRQAMTLASGARLTLNSDGSYAYDPNGVFRSLAQGETATDTFTYTVQDSAGATSTAQVTITVTGLDDVPVLRPVPDQSTKEGDLVSLTLVASDPDHGDKLSYTLISGPTGARVDAATGLFTWTALDGPATQSVTISVVDTAGLAAQQTFSITVADVPPVLTATGSANALAGDPYTLSLSAVDPGQDTIQYWMINWGEGASEIILGNPDRVTHVYAQPGVYAIQVSVVNEDGTFVGSAPAVSIEPKSADYLLVETFTPTATGFKVRFNHAFDVGSLNLYTAADHPMGMPDVILIGDKVGPISGSIVLDGDHQGFTFIRTGAVRQFDTQNASPESMLWHSLALGALGQPGRSVKGGQNDDNFGTLTADRVLIDAKGAISTAISGAAGGAGQDQIVYDAQPYALGMALTQLDGGVGTDTLSLRMTPRQYDLFQQELQGYARVLGPSESNQTYFTFNSIGLQLKAWEKMNVEVVRAPPIGGILPFDHYRAILVSGPNALQDGRAGLDGNRDGTPGDNFIATFDVISVGSGIISIGDFMRGPGQAVDVPATGKGLPVTFSSLGGVKSLVFTVDYDPALLTITGANAGPGLPKEASVKFESLAKADGRMQARISIASTKALTNGTLDLVSLVASVPATALYGSKEILHVAVESINGSAASVTSDGAVHVVGYFGDADGDAKYSTLDVQRITRLASNLDTGFSAWKLIDPMTIADLNSSGTLTSYDGQILMNEITGKDQREVPPIPLDIKVDLSGPDPLVNIPADLVGSIGETITVPVNIDNAAALESVKLRLAYDPTMLELVDVNRGQLTRDFGFYIESRERNSVYVDMATLQALEGGSGSLLELRFRIRAGTAPSIAIDLQEVSLNVGRLTLTPNPQIGADATDGHISVTAPLPSFGRPSLAHLTQGTASPGALPIPGMPDLKVHLPADLFGKVGQMVVVPVALDRATAIESVRLHLAYAAGALQLINVRRGHIGQDFAQYVETRKTGIVEVEMAQSRFPMGKTGSLLELEFRVTAETAAPLPVELTSVSINHRSTSPAPAKPIMLPVAQVPVAPRNAPIIDLQHGLPGNMLDAITLRANDRKKARTWKEDFVTSLAMGTVPDPNSALRIVLPPDAIDDPTSQA